MRKWSILFVTVSFLLPTPAQAQSAGVIATDSVNASASWVIARTSTSALYHFIEVDKSVDPVGATNTIADVGTVRCGIGAHGKTIVTSCTVVARIIFLKPQDFTFDVLLRSAQVTIRERGATHKAVWAVKEESTPTPSWALHGDGRVVMGSATVRTGAKARGSVLGKPFNTEKDQGIAKLARTESGEAIVEPNAGSYRQSYTHRSTTRRAALKWMRELVASL